MYHLTKTNLRAVDHAIDRITSLMGATSSLTMVKSLFDDIERSMGALTNPVDGAVRQGWKTTPFIEKAEVDKEGNVTWVEITEGELEKLKAEGSK